MVHAVRPDAMGRVASSIQLVARGRVYLEAQPLRRREGYARRDAFEARFAGKNPAARALDPGLRLADGFDGERFQPDRMRRVLVRLEQHQLGRAPVRTQPGLAIIRVGDVQSEDFGRFPHHRLGRSGVDFHMADRVHQMRHLHLPTVKSFEFCYRIGAREATYFRLKLIFSKLCHTVSDERRSAGEGFHREAYERWQAQGVAIRSLEIARLASDMHRGNGISDEFLRQTLPAEAPAPRASSRKRPHIQSSDAV